jgi:hypothetical protein
MSTFLTLSDKRAQSGLTMAAGADSLLLDLQEKGLHFLVSLFSSCKKGQSFGKRKSCIGQDD